MAATKTDKNRTSRNETPNTPDVSESKIARMKASDLRTRLARRGVKGTDEMKKPELVERFVKAELKSAKAEQKAAKAGAKSAKAGEKAAKAGAKSAKAGEKSAKAGGKNPTSHNDTPNTPEVSESKIARMKVDELRTRLARRGVKGTADLKKPELVQKLVQSLTNKNGKSSGRK